MPTNPTMEPSDIIAAINAHVGDDKAKAREFAKALRAGAREVAGSLIKIGGSQKQEEMGGQLRTMQGRIDELTADLEQKDQELAARAQAPDAKALEDAAKAKWEPKINDAKKRAETAEQKARELVKRVAKAKFASLLKRPDEQGMRVDDMWAEKVVAAEFDDRFVVGDDYSLSVLQPGETTAYDGETEDARIAALAADARRTVPAAYVVSNADSGGGVRNGGSGGGVGLKTVEQIKQEKRQSPAFAGL